MSTPASREALVRRLRDERSGRAARIAGPFTPILLLVVWEVASRSGLLDARFFPPPTSWRPGHSRRTPWPR